MELRRGAPHYYDHDALPERLSRSHYIGVPRRVLNEYLAGTYFLPKNSGGLGYRSDKSNVEQRIRRYRESIEGPLRQGYTKTFAQTRAWVQVQNACEIAIKENAIVVIYSKPGVGKSRCLLEFTRRNMLTAPVSILCSRNVTFSYFAQRLARGVGLSEHAITPRLEENVASKLNRYPRPLFIDQANFLCERALGTVCHIWECAAVPIVLAGTKSLYDIFMTSSLIEDVRAQLSSRIALYYELPELSKSEAKTIIERALGEDATDENIAQIYNITGGIYRHIDKIIPRILHLKERNAAELSSGKVLLTELIARAGSRIMISQ